MLFLLFLRMGEIEPENLATSLVLISAVFVLKSSMEGDVITSYNDVARSVVHLGGAGGHSPPLASKLKILYSLQSP